MRTYVRNPLEQFVLRKFPMEELLWLWMSVICGSLILELTHPGLFFFLSLSLGGSVALGMALAGLSLEIQVTIFIASAALAFIVLRAFVAGRKAGTHHKTNTEALIGKKAVVVSRIAYPSSGLVKVQGEVWSARAGEQEVVNPGEIVEIIAIIGCHLMVKKIDLV